MKVLRDCTAAFILTPWSYLVHILSFEFFLTRTRRANGGDIILLRAILIAIVLYVIAIGIKNWTDPTRDWLFSSNELRLQILATTSWFGTILAAAYAALYARFASQWSYLANLYNQIKATEIRLLTGLAEKKPPNASAKKVMQSLAEWKAAFIEDAENLHLATKKSIAPVIYFWLRENAVKTAYIAATPGGKERYQPLMDAAKKVTDQMGGIKPYHS